MALYGLKKDIYTSYTDRLSFNPLYKEIMMVRKLFIYCLPMGLFFVSLQNATAVSRLEMQQLSRLDPQTRLEQRCDIEAMERLALETRLHPDKALAYAFCDPKITKNHIIARGAAIRAHEHWYHLSYDCRTKDDALTIRSFSYKLGPVIPRKNWAKHYLVP